MLAIKPILFLGMYPWEYRDLSDTVRSMVKAMSGFSPKAPIFLNPMAASKRPQFRVSRYCDGGVEVWTPGFAFLPTRYGFGKIRDRLAASSVASYIDQFSNLKDSILYVTSATLELAEWYMNALRPNYLLFDVVDDNLGFPMEEDRRARLTRIFQQLARQATVITAVSQDLVNMVEQTCKQRAEYVPNGVDFAHFSNPSCQPADLTGTFKRRICFVGAFTSWIDLPLLSKTAERFPDTELLLVGPKTLADDQVDEFASLVNHPNVNWIGARPYEQVPAYLHAADVLILPRTKAAYSQACDPLKLYEYMATGKPVVTTDLPSANRFAEVVRITTSDDEFLAAIQDSFDRPNNREKQMEKVRERTWETRVRTLYKLFENKMERGRLA